MTFVKTLWWCWVFWIFICDLSFLFFVSVFSLQHDICQNIVVVLVFILFFICDLSFLFFVSVFSLHDICQNIVVVLVFILFFICDLSFFLFFVSVFSL